jgi:hypothetical protein
MRSVLKSMNLGMWVIAGLLGTSANVWAQDVVTKTDGDLFYVYSDMSAETNHFIPSGIMGDYSAVSIKAGQKLNPYSGTSCLRFTYTPPQTGLGLSNWAGVQWQNPEGNWGTRDGGFDITGAKRVTFWARGKNGGETIDKFQVGGITTGEYPDSDQEAIGPITLTKEWKQYVIDLSDSELSYIAGGFAWATSSRSAGSGITFYVDEIRYEF